MDQGSTRKRPAVHNFAPTITKFCHVDTKFGNGRGEIVDRRVILVEPWSMDQADPVC